MLSEEMKKEIIDNQYLNDDWIDGYCSALNKYIPKVEQLEQQNKELIEGLLEYQKINCYDNCELYREEKICMENCKKRKYKQLLEKILSKKWEDIINE